MHVHLDRLEHFLGFIVLHERHHHQVRQVKGTLVVVEGPALICLLEVFPE